MHTILLDLDVPTPQGLILVNTYTILSCPRCNTFYSLADTSNVVPLTPCWTPQPHVDVRGLNTFFVEEFF